MVSTRRRFVTDIVKASTASLFLSPIANALTRGQISGEIGGCHTEKRYLPFYSSVDFRRCDIPRWAIGGSDCVMEDGVIILRKDGTGYFACHVKTNFTHTQDVWHMHLSLGRKEYAEGQQAYKDFDWNGPGMSEKDNPQFHVWRQEFGYDPRDFGQIATAYMKSCC